MLPKLQNFPFKDGYKYFFFLQRITLIKNYYDIYTAEAGKLEGDRIAFAEQKTFKLKEEIVFFKDETRSEHFFSLQARNIFDFASVIDVYDASHNVVGIFKKDVGASLLRSTWQIQDKTGKQNTLLVFQEKSIFLAILRRFAEFIPLIEMFGELIRMTFVAMKNDEQVGSFTRGFGLKDTYLMEIREDVLEEIGIETILAQGVALDTLQDR